MSERHKKTEDCTFKIKTQKNEEISVFFFIIRHKVFKNMNEKISVPKLKFREKRK
jgi:hypothetical protein